MEHLEINLTGFIKLLEDNFYSGETRLFEQTFKNIDDVLWKEAGCNSELDYVEQTSSLRLHYSAVNADDLSGNIAGLFAGQESGQLS